MVKRLVIMAELATPAFMQTDCPVHGSAIGDRSRLHTLLRYWSQKGCGQGADSDVKKLCQIQLLFAQI